MEYRVIIRSAVLMFVALLFIVQQIYMPLRNVFIPIGEYFHSISYVLLAELLWVNQGLKGISVKTQLLFYLVHWTRYLDAFYHPHRSHYILSLKIWYMGVSLLVLVGIVILRSTYEREKDTSSLCLLTVFSLVLGTINYLISWHHPSGLAVHIFDWPWTVSHYLQGFAMLPQFIFCYRDPDNKDMLLLAYVISLGGYRIMYAFSWLSRLHHEKFFYVSGPLGLVILVIFLGDFLLYKIRDRSCISDFVLRIDDRVDELQQPLMSAFYRVSYNRLPDITTSTPTGNAFSHQYRQPPVVASQPDNTFGGEQPAETLRVGGGMSPPRLAPMEISLHGMDDGRRRSDDDGVGGGGYEDEDDEGFYDNYERRNNRGGYAGGRGGGDAGGAMYDLDGGGQRTQQQQQDQPQQQLDLMGEP
eukprot:GHVS01037502.1.p1 GENE.GHVS01037502.1~~GHVS01037502.1.p1  ORF type:complete len:414 (+),score=63.75 GHVS01037502.1:273-1514(+)